ncbi:MAG: hypothetical protein ACK6AT_13125 [Planctomycetota bacterium]
MGFQEAISLIASAKAPPSFKRPQEPSVLWNSRASLRRRENQRPGVLFLDSILKFSEFCPVFTFAMAHFEKKEKKKNFVDAIEIVLQRS